MKKLVILGAAGRTGQLLVNQALNAGYRVTAFTRGDTSRIAKRPNLRIVAGDAQNVDDLQSLFDSDTVVMSTLGSSKPFDRVIAQSTKALITAATQKKVPRVIMMSSFLVTENFQPNIAIRTALKLMNTIVRDINSGEALLKKSALNYTIVYATRLTNKPLNPHYKIVGPNEVVGATASISRADVASFLLKQISSTKNLRTSVLITDK